MIDLLVRRGFEDINYRAPGEIPFDRGAYRVVDRWVHEGWFGIHVELARWYRAERVFNRRNGRRQVSNMGCRGDKARRGRRRLPFWPRVVAPGTSLKVPGIDTRSIGNDVDEIGHA